MTSCTLCAASSTQGGCLAPPGFSPPDWELSQGRKPGQSLCLLAPCLPRVTVFQGLTCALPKTVVSHSLSISLDASGRRVNPVPVIPSWPEVGIAVAVVVGLASYCSLNVDFPGLLQVRSCSLDLHFFLFRLTRAHHSEWLWAPRDRDPSGATGLACSLPHGGGWHTHTLGTVCSQSERILSLCGLSTARGAILKLRSLDPFYPGPIFLLVSSAAPGSRSSHTRLWRIQKD